MGLFNRLFGNRAGANESSGATEAVLVHLDGTSLPDSVYEEYDLATIEDQLIAVLEAERLGELDGNEVGPSGATVFMYGPNAERLFTGVESVLRAYPLCQGARVIIRRGGPGATEREVQL